MIMPKAVGWPEVLSQVAISGAKPPAIAAGMFHRMPMPSAATPAGNKRVSIAYSGDQAISERNDEAYLDQHQGCVAAHHRGQRDCDESQDY